jgi:hypothetical protein
MKKITLKEPKRKMNIHLDEVLAHEIKDEALLGKTSMGQIIENRLFMLKKILVDKIKQ